MEYPSVGKDPDEQVPVEEPDGETVAPKDHHAIEVLQKLKMGLLPAAAQNKAQQDGVDPSVLERNPDEQVPVEEPDGETVALKTIHAIEVLQNAQDGLALAAAQNKAQQGGVDPSVLERNPTSRCPWRSLPLALKPPRT